MVSVAASSLHHLAVAYRNGFSRHLESSHTNRTESSAFVQASISLDRLQKMLYIFLWTMGPPVSLVQPSLAWTVSVSVVPTDEIHLFLQLRGYSHTWWMRNEWRKARDKKYSHLPFVERLSEGWGCLEGDIGAALSKFEVGMTWIGGRLGEEDEAGIAGVEMDGLTTDGDGLDGFSSDETEIDRFVDCLGSVGLDDEASICG